MRTIICAESGVVHYHWNEGDTGLCCTANTSGGYFVVATDITNCTVQSNQISINVLQAPQVSISEHSDTLIAYNETSYQWLYNGDTIAGATADFYVALNHGQYQVIVTDSAGCSATSSPINFTSVNSVMAQNIRISPNPAHGCWLISVDNELTGDNFEVYDDAGRMIYNSKITSAQFRLELNGAAGSVYLMKIITPTGPLSLKLLNL